MITTYADVAVLGDDKTIACEREWAIWLDLAATVAIRHAGKILPNELRRLATGKIAPQRLGPFVTRAVNREIVRKIDRQVSDDHGNRNGNKTPYVLEWLGAA